MANLADDDFALIQNVMKATGLTHEEAVHLVKLDQELDDLCDVVLSDMNKGHKESTIPCHKRG